MKYRGRVWKFGDNVDTDLIIPARYLDTSDPKELASHLMEPVDPQFSEKVKEGDILVAGRNFGCGSSREHAPVAIRGAGISCVVAKSFARIFYRNAFNTGLPILEAPEAAEEAQEGDILEVDLGEGKVRNLSQGKEYRAKPLPPFMQELIRDGGLMKHIAKRLREGEV
ncbi:MAG: 3-isopropylmalate dehydratase small subunit [Deltaproteobacteria bacterium]|nr:MAG: 3-isopropylmalate dehydratase small subunit [Deltaproteobacteria bacterium]